MIFRLVLLALLLIAGLFALYLVTRKKWDWDRYASSLAFIFATLLIVPLVIFAWVSYDNRVQVVNQLGDITLGSKAADIKLMKGEPAFEINRPEQKQFWHYQDKVNQGNFIDLVIKDQKVIEVSFVGSCEYCNRINGLGIGSNYQDIIDKLGKPKNKDVSTDQLEQRLNYPQYHCFFVVKEGKVIRHGVYLP